MSAGELVDADAILLGELLNDRALHLSGGRIPRLLHESVTALAPVRRPGLVLHVQAQDHALRHSPRLAAAALEALVEVIRRPSRGEERARGCSTGCSLPMRSPPSLVAVAAPSRRRGPLYEVRAAFGPLPQRSPSFPLESSAPSRVLEPRGSRRRSPQEERTVQGPAAAPRRRDAGPLSAGATAPARLPHRLRG